jgi:hypothetical protein
MVFILIFILSMLLFSNPGGESGEKSLFISPVKIPLSLSANFGELRIDHFHSGLDIRTQGVTGKEVVAAASGYVYRISVSPGGFGKALYLRHPEGYSTVYGHLDKFTPEIEEYVLARQYEEKSYMITLWPPKDRFEFKQGDLIAFSGNSGSSSGPHLHYEIRKSNGELPVNPLFFEFGINDDIKPVIEKLFIYPVSSKTVINNQNKLAKFNVSGGNGNYSVALRNEISINGPAGFGFKAYDLLNGSYTKCSVYSIELRIDSLPVYNYVMDEFAFNESRYINSHIDYEMFQREGIYAERAFVLPNDKLSIYKKVINKGIYNFNDGRKHHIEIILEDIHHNMSRLSFNINQAPAATVNNHVKTDNDNSVLMPYNRNNKFVSKNVVVNIPTGTLYDTLHFEFNRAPGRPSIYSDVFYIHNKYTPVHKAYTLYIKPDRVPQGKESKMIIIQLADDMKKNPLPSVWENDYISANPNTFGTFFVGIDTVPPLISSNGFSNGANMTGKTSIRLKITDDLSGIKSYDPAIDGKWALFEYDQKNNLLIYKFDPERIQKGTKHNLSLTVADNKDNLSSYNCEFTW